MAGKAQATKMEELAPRTDQAIEPVEQPAIHEVVVEHLRRAIHIGRFVPGDKFPPERELAKQLMVSRTTVREAIRVLESEGYVEIRRGSAGGIILLDRGQNEERLAPLVRSRLAELDEIIDFRIAVECGAVRLAAVRRTQKDLRGLEKAYAAMQAGWETKQFRSADSAFHAGIADASRNTWMRRAIEDARAAIWVPVDAQIPNVFHTAQLHHERILNAIRDRDPDSAEQAVADHIERTRQDLYRIAAAE